MERIKIELTTLSNLFIGDTPSSFEIGGIDQYTKTDFYNKPLVPASSLKGVLRRIISDMETDGTAEEIAKAYKDYFKDLCGSIPWNADDRSGSVYLLWSCTDF